VPPAQPQTARPAAPAKASSPHSDEQPAGVHPAVIAGGIAAGVLVLGLVVGLALRLSDRANAPAGAPAVAGEAAESQPASAAPPAQPSAQPADLQSRVKRALAGDDGTDKPLTTAEIVERSEGSVALIKGQVSGGTGFVVAPGVVATNSHVIAEELMSHLEIIFPSAQGARHGPFPAELLYEDTERDLALLGFQGDVPALKIANAFHYRKGEDVTVIGNPGDGPDQVLENAISRGVMSTKVTIDKQEYYQLSISVNPGNSGGPVFDSAGRVVGVVTLKSSDKEGVAFCIPIADLRAAMQSLDTQTTDSLEALRFKHRLTGTFKVLAQGGALYALGTFVRRAGIRPAASGGSAQEALRRLEEVIKEMEERQFPALDAEVGAIQSDHQLAVGTRQGMSDLFNNFLGLQRAYSAGGASNGGDPPFNDMRSLHRRLIEQLAPAIGVELPKQMMLVLQDQAPAAPDTTVFVVPRIRIPTPGVQRPPTVGPPRVPSAPFRGRMRPRRP
jgi:serine protease Do